MKRWGWRTTAAFAGALVLVVLATMTAMAAVLNPAFDGDGIRTVNMAAGKVDRFTSARVGADGKVYVGGILTRTSSGCAGNTTTEDQVMAVARVNPNGSLDAGFDGDGIKSINSTVCGTTGELSRGLGIQSTGKVILGGTTEATAGAAPTDIAIHRIHTNGAKDTTFGTDGTFKLNLSSAAETMWGLTVQPDNKIVIVANRTNGSACTAGTRDCAAGTRTDTDLAIVRLTADGAIDTGFAGGDGILDIDLFGSQNPRQAVLDSSGNIFVIGYSAVLAGDMASGSPAGVAVAVAKMSSSGVLDAAFGNNAAVAGVSRPGVARAQPITTTEGYDLGLQSDGKIVGCGYGNNSSTDPGKLDAIAYRFTTAGQPDSTFGTGGVTQINLANEDDRCRDMVVLPDDKILLVGSAKPNADDLNGLIVRLNSNGTRDNTFDGDGLKQLALGGTTDAFFGSAVAGPSDVYIAGFGGPATTPAGAEDSGKTVRYQGT